mmetsp:Transcript_23074/g.50628  ORF Transcript_23074/g.50628 Transcript_23074/m.50628 type:complete len:80 (+) Transcript_23074:99-338(+)
MVLLAGDVVDVFEHLEEDDDWAYVRLVQCDRECLQQGWMPKSFLQPMQAADGGPGGEGGPGQVAAGSDPAPAAGGRADL